MALSLTRRGFLRRAGYVVGGAAMASTIDKLSVINALAPEIPELGKVWMESKGAAAARRIGRELPCRQTRLRKRQAG